MNDIFYSAISYYCSCNANCENKAAISLMVKKDSSKKKGYVNVCVSNSACGGK